jgi:hypothetical protein
MSRFAEWLDEHPRLLIVALVITYFTIALPNAYLKPLWHDELVTYNLACSPSVSQMLDEVRQIDLNPPVLYFLDFIAIRIPGTHLNDHLVSLAARLPSILGGLMASVGLLFLLRGRLGALFALSAVGLLWTTAFLPYTWEDRPYALVTGFLMLSVLVWERTSHPQRSLFWVAAALCMGLAMVGSHFMSSFLMLAFLATEFVKVVSRRRVDIPLCVAYTLPFAIPVYYYSKVSGYHSIIFPEDYQPSLISIPIEYGVLLRYSVLILGACLALYMVKILMPSPSGYHPTTVPVSAVAIPATRSELLLLAGIFLEPALAVIAIMRSHGAFFLRYGLPGCIPIAILLTVFLFALFEKSKAAALLIAFISIAVAATSSFRDLLSKQPLRPSYAQSASSIPAEYRTIEPDLPFVDASGLTFVEMNHREPAEFLHRTYYLTDTPSAVKYAHATLFEGEAETAGIFHFQGKVEPLQSFEAAHPKFLVLGTFNYPEDWLLKKLRADGDTLRSLGAFETTYKDKEIYEVTVKSIAK